MKRTRQPLSWSLQLDSFGWTSRSTRPRSMALLACAGVLLLARLGACQVAVQEAPKAVFGQLQVVIVHEKEGEGPAAAAAHKHQRRLSSAIEGDGLHVQHFLLRLRSGRALRLVFPSQPKHMPRTGSYLMVRLADAARCNTTLALAAAGAAGEPAAAVGAQAGLGDSAICVGRMIAQEAAPRDVFAASQPRGQYAFKTLVMQLQVCGQGPATTTQALEGALFDGLPHSQPQTVQGAFRACSYGNADFSRASGVEVLSLTVPIPCTGKTPWSLPYDSKSCPYIEWSDVANQYVHDQGIAWDTFKHKIYVVPPGDLCGWGGMGYVGCTQDCRAWISGDLWQYPTTWLHELGHNLYMNHAGSYQDASMQFINYKDDSGAMGHCCSMRCFNAPHSYQVGWVKPVEVLHKDNLVAGVWQSYTLPPRQGPGSADTNMLRVLGDWNGPSAAFNIFVEFRSGEGFDAGLLDSVKDRVTIYSTPLGDAMPFTTLEAAVGSNQILHETRMGSGLAIWVGAKTATGGIRVHLCRPEAATETACDDGRDNDCDGYTDGEDTECKQGPTSTRRLMTPDGQPAELKGQQQQQAEHTSPGPQQQRLINLTQGGGSSRGLFGLPVAAFGGPPSSGFAAV